LVVEPRVLAPIDLQRIAAAVSVSEAADLTEADPKKLRARIAELEGRNLNSAVVDDLRKRLAHSEEWRQNEHARAEEGWSRARQLEERLNAVIAALGMKQTEYVTQDGPPVRIATGLLSSEPNNRAAEKEPSPVRAPEPASIPAQRTSRPTEGSDESGLSACQRAILTALAQTGGCELEQLGILARYKITGAFHGALADLRAREYVNRGRPIAILPAGLEALGPYDPLPTGKKLRDYWLTQLTLNERGILSTLFEARPHTLTLEEIAGHTGYKITGAFHGAIAKLRKLKLVDGPGKALKAAETLYQ
jgi:hypothetical protein